MEETQEIIIPPEEREQIIKVNSLLNTYNENKSIRFKTPMLRSNLCDY